MDIYLLLQCAEDLKQFAEKIKHSRLLDCSFYILEELQEIQQKKSKRGGNIERSNRSN